MKTPTHNATPGTLHAPCTYASMQSVLVKIAPPAQPPAPCDQRTVRVRVRVDLCLDLLAKLSAAICDCAVCNSARGEYRASHGLPVRFVASCTVPAADVRGREEEHRSSLRGSLRLACEVHAAIGGTGLPAPRSASCERCRVSCNRASAHAWPRCIQNAQNCLLKIK